MREERYRKEEISMHAAKERKNDEVEGSGGMPKSDRVCRESRELNNTWLCIGCDRYLDEMSRAKQAPVSNPFCYGPQQASLMDSPVFQARKQQRSSLHQQRHRSRANAFTYP